MYLFNIIYIILYKLNKTNYKCYRFLRINYSNKWYRLLTYRIILTSFILICYTLLKVINDTYSFIYFLYYRKRYHKEYNRYKYRLLIKILFSLIFFLSLYFLNFKLNSFLLIIFLIYLIYKEYNKVIEIGMKNIRFREFLFIINRILDKIYNKKKKN